MNARTVELVSVLGLENAMVFMEAFGGTRVSIPKTADRGRRSFARYADVIGSGGARALCAAWGGSEVTIPQGRDLRYAKRVQAIVADSRNLSVTELARRYRISERSVQQILRGRMPEIPQDTQRAVLAERSLGVVELARKFELSQRVVKRLLQAAGATERLVLAPIAQSGATQRHRTSRAGAKGRGPISTRSRVNQP